MKRLPLVALLGGMAFALPVMGADDPKSEKHGVKLTEWIRRLDSPDIGVRNNAASVLIGFGESAEPATASLAKLLREDKNADIRRHSALALGEIGRKAKEATGALSKAASKDDDPSVRVCSAQALARVNPDRVPEAVKALVKFVPKTNGGFDRINAIEGLGEIGAKARSAAPELRVAARDEDRDVSKAARDALRRIESK